ncbi:MAG: hypothetical protein WCO29_19405, partial [Nostocales cyanobacterium ELA583]
YHWVMDNSEKSKNTCGMWAAIFCKSDEMASTDVECGYMDWQWVMAHYVSSPITNYQLPTQIDMITIQTDMI